MNPPNTANLSNAQSAASPIVDKKVKKKGDIGKRNNGKTTGFKVVAQKAATEYGSQAAGNRVAGAIAAKIRAKA